MIAFRDYHALTHENGSLDSHVHIHHEKLVSVRPYVDRPPLYFAHDADEVDSQGYWYRNFEYTVERERGLDCIEDLFNPFTMHFNLQARNTAAIIASPEIMDVGSAETLRLLEVDRDHKSFRRRR